MMSTSHLSLPNSSQFSVSLNTGGSHFSSLLLIFFTCEGQPDQGKSSPITQLLIPILCGSVAEPVASKDDILKKKLKFQQSIHTHLIIPIILESIFCRKEPKSISHNQWILKIHISFCSLKITSVCQTPCSSWTSENCVSLGRLPESVLCWRFVRDVCEKNVFFSVHSLMKNLFKGVWNRAFVKQLKCVSGVLETF